MAKKGEDCGSKKNFGLLDSTKRLPIGSMGDGMWRILGLALAIVFAKDGVLAKRLNVQVFATTHSSDRQLHQAIKERILNPKHPKAEIFFNWFKALYDL
ncbi:MAG: DUF3226 domain-containing protein [Nostocales cyanobacterium 94392]|nr:DUF3226 domain-containing protein [Nostocales cyanobacterium 94392]